MERPGRMKLDLEAVMEDASDEVYSFQIQRSLIYLKFVGVVKNNISSYYQKSFSRRDYISEILLCSTMFGYNQQSFHLHLQKWLHTLVKERFLSTLGSQIGPIVWTLVIRQVARQPLPRVIPEKTYIGVPHCYRQTQDTWSLICGWSFYLLL